MLVHPPYTLAPRSGGALSHWEKGDFLLGLQADIRGEDRQDLVICV